MIKVEFMKSTRKGKKLMAIFTNHENGEFKIIHFGQLPYLDFTIHKDKERKERYIARHSKRENWNNPYSAGTLSRYILWNKPTIKASIKDFKKKFNLF